jgi:hypothetical protein
MQIILLVFVIFGILFNVVVSQIYHHDGLCKYFNLENECFYDSFSNTTMFPTIWRPIDEANTHPFVVNWHINLGKKVGVLTTENTHVSLGYLLETSGAHFMPEDNTTLLALYLLLDGIFCFSTYLLIVFALEPSFYNWADYVIQVRIRSPKNVIGVMFRYQVS